MLRRTLCFSAVHRTLSGVTLSGAHLQSILDAAVSVHQKKQQQQLQSPAAINYWVTRELAAKNCINIRSDAKSVELNLSPEQERKIQSKQGNETAAAAATATEREEGILRIFPLSCTDAPHKCPIHETSTGKKLPLLSQMLLEKYAARKGFSSKVWYSQRELAAVGALWRVARVEGSDESNSETGIRLPVRLSSSFSAAAVASSYEATPTRYYNEEELLPLSAFPGDRSQQQQSGNNSDQLSRDNDDGTANGAQRSGLGKQLPQLMQAKLLEIKVSRGYKSNRWFTPSQMHQAMLRCKSASPAAVTVECLTPDGNLLKFISEDELVAGGSGPLSQLLGEYFPPRFASEQQEQLARQSNSILDGCGRLVWRPEVKTQLLKAYLQRQVAETLRADQEKTAAAKHDKKNKNKKNQMKQKTSKAVAQTTATKKRAAVVAGKQPIVVSCQFLRLWEITALGHELVEGAKAVEVTDSGNGSVSLLYNRDDCRKLEHP